MSTGCSLSAQSDVTEQTYLRARSSLLLACVLTLLQFFWRASLKKPRQWHLYPRKTTVSLLWPARTVIVLNLPEETMSMLLSSAFPFAKRLISRVRDVFSLRALRAL